MGGQRYSIVLFDADNTLFDFDTASATALTDTLLKWGIEVTPKLLHRYHVINDRLWASFDRGEADREWLTEERFRLLLEEFSLTGDTAEINRDYQRGLAENATLLPGAEELCARLDGLCHQCIITNGLTLAQQGRVERSALAPYLKDVFISQELGCRKPERRFFDIVFQRLGLTEEELPHTVVVGDSLTSDIQGGIAAGVDTIWLNRNDILNTTSITPTWTVYSLEAVGRIILGR